MQLRPETIRALRQCTSVNQPNGFRTASDIRTFWKRYGATGFLNIRDISPAMVREIRQNIIEARPNE